MPNAKVIIDLSKIAEKEFDPSLPLRVAAVRGGGSVPVADARGSACGEVARCSRSGAVQPNHGLQ